MNTVLVWDIENVPLTNYKKIMSLLKYKANIFYAVSKCKITKKEQAIIDKLGIVYIRTKKIADISILELLDFYSDRVKNFILISGDGDFSDFTRSMLNKNKRVQIIMQEDNNRKVLMNNDITDKNITLSVIPKNDYYRVKKGKQNVQNKSKKVRKDFGSLDFFSLRDSLSSLEENTIKDIVVDSKVVKEKEKKKKKVSLCTMEDRLLFIEKRIIHLINNYYAQRKDGVCSCCGITAALKDKQFDTFYCLDCEKKFVFNFMKRTDLTHEEKIVAFEELTQKEIEKYGNILFSEEVLKFDLLVLELSKIRVPERMKIENLIKG